MTDLQPHRPMTPEHRHALGVALSEQYRQGQSIAQLAAQHSTSAGRVRALLLEQGVVLRPRGGRVGRTQPGRQELAAQISRQYADGASLSELGQQHARSASSVRGLVLAGGGTLRARGGRRPGARQAGATPPAGA